MNPVTRVEFHCHSTFSDGTLAPEELAARLAAAGVACAALTDHDTVDGLEGFQRVLARRGVGFITGLEMTVQCEGREAHLLAYGFDPLQAELQATLASLRQSRDAGVQSIAGSIRKMGASGPKGGAAGGAQSAAMEGRIGIAEAIALIHRAGGRAFLAHPLLFEPDMAQMESLLSRLKEQGLDGAEALYGPAAEEQRQSLCDLARRLGLLVSAGTDAHDGGGANGSGLGIEIPTEIWKTFRDAVCSSGGVSPQPRPSAEPHRRAAPRYKPRNFFFHVIFPTILAIGLFIAAIFAVLLPAFERSLLDRKREMIRELTNSAWSILAEYEREERAGLLTRGQAQKMAASRIEFLRYGRESKDYFWLQDLHPRIIMHPYRKDLNGKDVTDFRDPRGTRIFVEFANLVQRKKEGYIEYVWQWKDDPGRLVPKESYIKGFEPWGWLIGTGIYIEDVHQELSRMEGSLVRMSLGISAIVALLLFYVIQQSMRLERERFEAEEGLRESTERYRSLVEAATEGTVLVLDGRCRYANPILLEMLGYSEQEIELLDLADLIPPDAGNASAWEHVNRLKQGEEPSGGFEGALKQRDGALIECVFALSRISFGGKSGFILLAKDVRPRMDSLGKGADGREVRAKEIARLTSHFPVGIFRARAARGAAMEEANPAALKLFRLRPIRAGEAAQGLADLFQSPEEYDEFFQRLIREGSITRRLIHFTTPEAQALVASLSAVLIRDAHGLPRFIDGVIEDVTAIEKRETQREALLEKLQTSLLFLHEPVGGLRHETAFCPLETPIHKAAMMMSAQKSSAVLVQSDTGAAVGIVTDRDLRDRVVAAGANAKEPVYHIMSSPIAAISEKSQVYEALLLMQEKGVQHLAVMDDSGRITGTIHGKELIQFHRYGSIVLTREIARAATPETVVRCCRRTPELVKALVDCGARTRNISRMIASICDSATERFLQLAEKELGPPPVPYAFLALGSQGRQEQTLFTDQDNAILFAQPETEAQAAEIQSYFAELGRRVCEWLDQAGYAYCRGGIMAKEPKWRQPLSVWKDYFSDWIRKAEPQELLEFSIFFDFRAVHGNDGLTAELRRYVQEVLRDSPAFYPHFAQNSLSFKPPVWLFGKILVGGAAGDHAGLLNLKDAMMPIVNFARLYALKHEIEKTHTIERLDALAEKNLLAESSHEDIVLAYDFLMRLRLSRQTSAIASGQNPDNNINPRKLPHVEETLLKQSFAQIAAVQKKISYDFLGGTN